METLEKTQKEFIDQLKTEWKKLWRERIDDKIRAEGIANKDYTILFVEKGTIILATRDFKPPDFQEILKQHQITEIHKIVPPNPSIGGWRKFIRTVLSPQTKHNINRQAFYIQIKKKPQQLKKGGRGWLHYKIA
ncbi:MAG: hypothetical protein QXE76_07630 [Candidatus Bathyarchaeia archaeon]